MRRLNQYVRRANKNVLAANFKNYLDGHENATKVPLKHYSLSPPRSFYFRNRSALQLF